MATRRYTTKGDTWTRAALREVAGAERDAAAREGREAHPIDAIEVTEARRVLSASEALMRIFGGDVATWDPPVTAITVYPPEQGFVYAHDTQTLEEAADLYVGTLERYLGRPGALQGLTICDYFGCMGHATLTQVRSSSCDVLAVAPNDTEASQPARQRKAAEQQLSYG